MAFTFKGSRMTTSFPDASKVWARIGLLSFGGPAGQIALLHKEIVDERKWLSESEFLNALNFCMLLPGPEAMQLATYCGWRLNGVRGGLAAGILFVLPGAAVILALSYLYALFGQVPFIQAAFFGIKCAVVAIVLEALLKIARRALHRPMDWVLAAAAFLALFVFSLPFPLVVLTAGLIGFALSRPTANDGAVAKPPVSQTIRTVAAWLAIWLVPLAVLMLTLGPNHVQSELARLFSVLAVVTFGGAYSVLASLGQTVVEQMGWLTTEQMMDGFGLAETTPGPLILVGQFVAFAAAAGTEKNLWQGFFASLVFLWMTFTPCFLWIFAGAPWIEYLSSRPRLKSALSAITAAVTGVILNLALWFALHVLFGKVERLTGPAPVWWPDTATFDPAALGLTILTAAALLFGKSGILKTLALGLCAGLFWRLATTGLF
jgi:chromate transporter